MKTTLTVLIFLVGVGNALPILGVLGANRLATMYGVTIADPDLLLLMQHRAVLLGILGGFIMASAFMPGLRNAAFIAGFISMLSFLLLAWLTGEHNALTGRIILADVVLVALFVPALVIHLRN
jgi:hypothetical protein